MKIFWVAVLALTITSTCFSSEFDFFLLQFNLFETQSMTNFLTVLKKNKRSVVFKNKKQIYDFKISNN